MRSKCLCKKRILYCIQLYDLIILNNYSIMTNCGHCLNILYLLRSLFHFECYCNINIRFPPDFNVYIFCKLCVHPKFYVLPLQLQMVHWIKQSMTTSKALLMWLVIYVQLHTVVESLSCLYQSRTIAVCSTTFHCGPGEPLTTVDLAKPKDLAVLSSI